MDAELGNGGIVPRRVWIIAVTVSVAAMVFAAICPLYATDTLARYAPMAEAFAAGDFAEAFHPRFGIGLPIAAGVLCRLGLDGLSACAAASTLVWGLGAIPLWLISASVFDRRTAWFALILYLICPQTILWGVKGFRETFKMVGVLLMVAGLFEIRDSPRGSVVLSRLGMILLCWFKPDAILLCGILTLAFAVLTGFRRLRTWANLGVFVLIVQPMCVLTWCWTGWWLPSSQYVTMLTRIIRG